MPAKVSAPALAANVTLLFLCAGIELSFIKAHDPVPLFEPVKRINYLYLNLVH